MKKVINLSLIESNIIAIHPSEMIFNYFDNNTDMLYLLKYCIRFPIYAEFGFANKEVICKIEGLFKCGYIADMVIPDIRYCDDLYLIRQHFENVFYRNDENSKKYLQEKLGLHDWAWVDKTYNTMNSNRKIYVEDVWNGIESRSWCIFDFKENPSINFANVIKRMIAGLIYGFYKYGVGRYELYDLPSLDVLYSELYQDENINSGVKSLIEKDLIYY